MLFIKKSKLINIRHHTLLAIHPLLIGRSESASTASGVFLLIGEVANHIAIIWPFLSHRLDIIWESRDNLLFFDSTRLWFLNRDIHPARRANHLLREASTGYWCVVAI